MSESAVLLIFILFSLPMVVSDFRTMHISVAVNYAGVAAALLANLLLSGSVIESFFTGIGSFVFLFIIKKAAGGGLGEGDLHYGFFCGAFLLSHKVIFGFLFSSVFGILSFCFAFLTGRGFVEEKFKIPFVPFMFAGSLVSFALKISV